MNRKVFLVGTVVFLFVTAAAMAQHRGGPVVGPPTEAPTGQVPPEVAAKFVGDVGELTPPGASAPSVTTSLFLDVPAFDRLFMMSQNNGTQPQTCVILNSANSFSAVAMLSQPLSSRDGLFHVVVTGQATITNTTGAPDQKAVRIECKVFDIYNNEVADCWGITGPQSNAGNFVRSNPNDTPHQVFGAFAGYAEAGGPGTYRVRIRVYTNNWVGTFCYGNLIVHYNFSGT